MNTLWKKFLRATLAIRFILALAACGSDLQGTYSNEPGTVVVELRSGGKARATVAGESEDCISEAGGGRVKVNGQGEELELTVLDDGGLAGGGFIGTLRRRSS